MSIVNSISSGQFVYCKKAQELAKDIKNGAVTCRDFITEIRDVAIIRDSNKGERKSIEKRWRELMQTVEILKNDKYQDPYLTNNHMDIDLLYQGLQLSLFEKEPADEKSN